MKRKQSAQKMSRFDRQTVW